MTRAPFLGLALLVTAASPAAAYMNDVFFEPSSAPPQMGGTYRPVAGNFDGVGGDDIFWYGTGATGDILWLAGPGRTFQAPVPQTMTGTFQPVVGDFDGNGRDDILWYPASGTAGKVWYFKNGPTTHAQVALTVPSGCTPVVADFTGDGRADIFFYKAGAATSTLFTSTGTAFTQSTIANPTGTGWSPVAGDFDGDGRGDVAFVDASSATSNPVLLSAVGAPLSVSQEFSADVHPPVVAGDFDHDGKTDLLSYNTTTGRGDVWYSLGIQPVPFCYCPPQLTLDQGRIDHAGAATPFIGDFDGDGSADVFWYGTNAVADDLWWGAPTQPHVSEYRNLEFATFTQPNGTIHLAIDMVVPTTPGTHPVIAYLHAGGWSGGPGAQEITKTHFLRRQATRGYAVASIGYRAVSDRPDSSVPVQYDTVRDMVKDVLRGIRFLRSNAATYHLDPTRMMLSGGSAGGHLALLAAAMRDDLPLFSAGDLPANLVAVSDAVSAVASFAGPTDPVVFYNYDNPISADAQDFLDVLVQSMMGCSPDGTAPAPGTDALPACSVGEQHDAQPLAWANAGDPPVYLVHGDQDGIAPPDQAYYYAYVGGGRGLTVTADIVAGAGHNLAFDLNLGALENFIDSHIGN